MRGIVLAALAVLACAATVSAQNPGFAAALTNKGIDYARQVALPIIQQELSTITIPDQSGKADTPVGHVDYDLSDIKTTSVNLGTSSITVGPSGLSLSLSGVALGLDAHYHIKESSFPHISMSGGVTISASSISVSIVITIGLQSGGVPSVNTASCSADIGHMDVKVSGDASWFVNLFDSLIADTIKKSINSQLCSIISNEINVAGNKALATIPVVEKIDSISEINYAFLKAPTMGADYVMTSHKGEFFWIAHPDVEAPFTPAAIPTPGAGELTRMFYVYITGYFPQTAAFVYQEADALRTVITQNDLPPNFPVKLNTTYFGALIPALGKMYPNLPMELLFQTTGAPVTPTITPSSMTVAITCNVTAVVLFPNGTAVEAFTIDITIQTSGRVWVAPVSSQEYVFGNLTFLNLQFSLSQTAIGQFPVAPLQALVDLLAQGGVVPELNKRINKGFPIPVVDGVAFVNPEVVFGDGYIRIDTDFSYNPSYLTRNKAEQEDKPYYLA